MKHPEFAPISIWHRIICWVIMLCLLACFFFSVVGAVVSYKWVRKKFWSETLMPPTSVGNTVTIPIFREGNDITVRQTNSGKIEIHQVGYGGRFFVYDNAFFFEEAKAEATQP